MTTRRQQTTRTRTNHVHRSNNLFIPPLSPGAAKHRPPTEPPRATFQISATYVGFSSACLECFCTPSTRDARKSGWSAFNHVPIQIFILLHIIIIICLLRLYSKTELDCTDSTFVGSRRFVSK